MFGPQAHARQALFAVTVAPVSGRRVGINFRPGVCSAVRSGVLLVGMRRVGSVVSFFFASGGDEVCSNVFGLPIVHSHSALCDA